MPPPKKPTRPAQTTGEVASRAAAWGAIPMLLIAVTGFVQAKTATEKERVAKKEERSLGDNYQGYVEDRITRDEALEKAFIELVKRCGCPCPGIEAVAAGAAPPAAAAGPTITADAAASPPSASWQEQEIPSPKLSPSPPPLPPTSIDLDALAAEFGYRYKK